MATNMISFMDLCKELGVDVYDHPNVIMSIKELTEIMMYSEPSQANVAAKCLDKFKSTGILFNPFNSELGKILYGKDS